jgi:cardiolipin synthase A/B
MRKRNPIGCPKLLHVSRTKRNAGWSNFQVIESPDACFRFDHRKVALIDDRVGWTGGMILTAPSLFRWHNFAFLAGGPIVPQYATLFADRWAELGGEPALPCPLSDENALVLANSVVRMVRTDIGQRSLKEAVYGAVDQARHHIYVENPYFSDQILVKKLAAACARGVDVRAVLTLRGDIRLMNRLSTVTANHLLRAGAKAYLYPSMTHVKAMSVDGTLAYIGTGNFDDLSLRNNREVALTVRGTELIRQIDEGLFLRDMAASQELIALLPWPQGWWFLTATSAFY